jgi:hypothetical protein
MIRVIALMMDAVRTSETPVYLYDTNPAIFRKAVVFIRKLASKNNVLSCMIIL